MSDAKVSVIIPAYNQADFLGEAIQSVLDQTYSNFEVIVVNDASPDHTTEVVRQFDDPRLKYIVHEENRGLPATRNTGIRASSGEIIALLDSDDIFHPEKLQVHVEFLANHPDVGVSYNARFELNYSSKTIRELIQPPPTVTLADLVLGFPFTPSDIVLRKDWVFQVDLYDESYRTHYEDLDMNCRLGLAGCQFASVSRALNYRRHLSGRILGNIEHRLNIALHILDTTFSDTRCPDSVLALRDIAFMNFYLVWAGEALAQGITATGQKFVREAVRLNSSILYGKPCELVKFLVLSGIADESVDHEARLNSVFNQLPPELAWLSEQYDWAVARGYLLKGGRAIIWGRFEDGREYFGRAAHLGAQIDEPFLQMLAHQLLGYEAEFGIENTQDILQRLAPFLERIGTRKAVRRLKACFSVNRAFQSYRAGDYSTVPTKVMGAIANDPQYLTNRGVLAILLRSIVDSRLQLGA